LKSRGKKKRSGTAVGTRRDAAGRLHLALHRDPVTGREGIALEVPVFAESWQNDVAAGTANTAYATLGRAATLDGTVELARHLLASTSRLTDGLLARAPAGAVACRAGCDHCCHQIVGVTPPEALAIFDHLSRTASDAELAEISARVAEARARTRGLTSAERFSPDHPCPFLRTGRCSIYEVRPLSCRGMNSLDAHECETRLREPAAREAFLAEASAGRSFMEPIRAFHAVSAGLQLALAELYNLDMRALDLTAAMDLLLNGAESIPSDWIATGHPFEPARTDERDEHALRRMSGVLTRDPDRDPT
jgi:Fe-S-cluster containining protein